MTFKNNEYRRQLYSAGGVVNQGWAAKDMVSSLKVKKMAVAVLEE